jgi:hypothetical protein
MARNRVDDCLFCEQRPCACNKPARPERKSRPTRIPVAGAGSPDPERDAGPVRQVGSARTTYAEPKVKVPVRIPNTVPSSVLTPIPAWRPARVNPENGEPETPGLLEPQLTKQVRQFRSQEETELRAALTVLADAELLCAEDLERERERIDLPSWRIDALIWKQA